uniref:PCZ2.5 n=1 Tax=Planococcus sp. ZOYM TaxID=378212 RepID=Q1PHH2_9BACL|nr:hypothetical protein [Planococcus sp. ZOYM]ABE02511.1 PCZ2.5 [Planococcus sp. ZOYM]
MVLAGCNDHTSLEKLRKVKEVLIADRNQEAVLSATPLKLTQQQKEAHYKLYEEITKKVSSEYDKDLELKPLEEFKPEEWVTPEDLEQLAITMATMEFTSKVYGGDPVD